MAAVVAKLWADERVVEEHPNGALRALCPACGGDQLWVLLEGIAVCAGCDLRELADLAARLGVGGQPPLPIGASKLAGAPTARQTKALSESDLVRELTAPGGFLLDFVEYASPLTDAPKVIHLAAGISTLMMAMGKRVWYLSWGGKRRYPNGYLCIITPSGFFRKGTALDIGRRLLTEVQPDLVLPNEFSIEQLLASLSKQRFGGFYIDEVGHLYAQFGRSYMAGAQELFAQLWDNVTQARALRSGHYHVEEPAPSILAATTAEFLEDKIRLKDVEAGFWGRWLFIPAQQKEPSPRGNLAPDAMLWGRLTSHLRKVIQLDGEADFTQVQDDVDDWISEHEKVTTSVPELTTFHSRGGEYLKKLCLVAQASLDPQCGGGKFPISAEAFRMAASFSEWHREQLSRVFADELAFSWMDEQRRKVRRLLEGAGGEMDHSQVLRRSHLTAQQLRQVGDTMQETGELIITQINPTPGRKPVKVWRLTSGP